MNTTTLIFLAPITFRVESDIFKSFYIQLRQYFTVNQTTFVDEPICVAYIIKLKLDGEPIFLIRMSNPQQLAFATTATLFNELEVLFVTHYGPPST